MTWPRSTWTAWRSDSSCPSKLRLTTSTEQKVPLRPGSTTSTPRTTGASPDLLDLLDIVDILDHQDVPNLLPPFLHNIHLWLSLRTIPPPHPLRPLPTKNKNKIKNAICHKRKNKQTRKLVTYNSVSPVLTSLAFLPLRWAYNHFTPA